MKKILLYVLLLLLSPVVYGQQSNSTINNKERIINFHSYIIIDTTGIIHVTESIKVFATGHDIKRGIVRTIPTYRTDKNGKKKKINIDIVTVSCNGHKENYRTERAGDNIEIFIGNPKVYLELGIYEYVIAYESTGQIGFFDTFDEFYWNVTGNEWLFEIERASASIMLPNNIRNITTSCYTGNSGSTVKDCLSKETENKVYFETCRPLEAYQGLTVAVSFPRDIIKRPALLELFWRDSKSLLSAFFCLMVVGFFFYFNWRKFEKDPEKPAVVPTFKPPHGISPAAARYLFRRMSGNKGLTAALVEMAVKKAIRISYQKTKYVLIPIERKDNLTVEEKVIYDTLFTDDQSIAILHKNYKKIAKANSNLEKSLKTNWNLKEYFQVNLKLVVWGAVLSVILIALHFILFEVSWITGMLFFVLLI